MPRVWMFVGGSVPRPPWDRNDPTVTAEMLRFLDGLRESCGMSAAEMEPLLAERFEVYGAAAGSIVAYWTRWVAEGRPTRDEREAHP